MPGMKRGLILVVGVVLAWFHGAQYGAALDSAATHLLRRFFYAALIVLFPTVALWNFPRAKRVAVALSYLIVCAYTISVMADIFSSRRPDAAGALPDLGHDLTVGLNWSQDWSLGAYIPDSIMVMLLVPTALFVLAHPLRWVILRRTCSIYGTLMLLRASCVAVTSFPESPPECRADAMAEPISWSAMPLRMVALRTLHIVFPIGHTPCGDTIFTTHPIVLVLCAMVWHEYYAKAAHSFNPVKTGAWGIALCGLFAIIATRLHYTLDVLLALYLTVQVWIQYHQIAADVVRRHRFITVWLLDGLVLYPSIEFLEHCEAADAATDVCQSPLLQGAASLQTSGVDNVSPRR